jgi:hypothetical protein
MDEAALLRVIRHWNSKGARVRVPPVDVGKSAAFDRAPLIGKLAAQCHALGRPFPAYPLAILKQMGCGVDRIEWAPAPMLRKVVAAMAYYQKRRF